MDMSPRPVPPNDTKPKNCFRVCSFVFKDLILIFIVLDSEPVYTELKSYKTHSSVFENTPQPQLREAAKKVILLMALPFRGGEAKPFRKNECFFTFFPTAKIRLPLSSRRVGEWGLHGTAIKKITFFCCFPNASSI